MASNDQVNIIRKIEVVEGHGHHGGAWKVAYADFMTAMMAFFLLMWILSSSDEQKLRGIAEYFTNATLPGGSGVLDGATLGPPGTLNASNGATVARGAETGPEDDPSPAKWEVMDKTATVDPEEKVRGSQQGRFDNPAGGAASSTPQDSVTTDTVSASAGGGNSETANDSTETMEMASAAEAMKANTEDALEAGAGNGVAEIAAEQSDPHAEDNARFEEMKNEILQAMQASQDLAPLQKNLIFEKTPEGMLVQIIDQKGQPMFASGKAKMNKTTIALMELLGESLKKLPNDMVISGHTDAVPFSNSANYDNWDLSSDRANSMRRVLLKTGIDHDRILRVSGMADTRLLKPEAPKDAANRRIEVLLSYEKPAVTAPVAAPKTQVAVSKPQMPSKPEPVAAPAPENTVTLLDEQVFENLRSALR